MLNRRHFRSTQISRIILMTMFPILLYMNYAEAIANGNATHIALYRQLAAYPSQAVESVGCCHSFGFGNRMIPCCHNFTDQSFSSCTTRNQSIGGIHQWYAMSCATARAIGVGAIF